MLILTVFHCLGNSTPYFPWSRIQNAPLLPFSLLFCRSRYLRRRRCLSSLILRGRRYQRLKPDLKLRPKYSCLINVNPRTYKESHIPTVVQGGWRNPSPEVSKCCSISKRFCLQWKAFDPPYKMRYILWVVALLEAWDVTKHGCHLGRHLGFYQELENR